MRDECSGGAHPARRISATEGCGLTLCPAAQRPAERRGWSTECTETPRVFSDPVHRLGHCRRGTERAAHGGSPLGQRVVRTPLDVGISASKVRILTSPGDPRAGQPSRPPDALDRPHTGVAVVTLATITPSTCISASKVPQSDVAGRSTNREPRGWPTVVRSL